MAWAPRSGMRVLIQELGPAVVVRPTRTGALVTLEDMPGLKLEFPLDQIHQCPEEVTPEPSAGSDGAAVAEETAFAAQGIRERRDLEALRFGLVPTSCIEELTLGFEPLREWVSGRMPHAHGGKPQASCISGPFGTGKSHTMAVVRHVAQSQGYLTASVEVDGQNISLSKPEPLLYSLWSTLSGRGLRSSTPLLDLYLKAVEAGHPPPTIASGGIDRVYHNYKVAQVLRQTGHVDSYGYALDAVLSSSDEFTANQVAAMLCTERNITTTQATVKRMIGIRASDRPYDFVESLVGHAVVGTLAGFKGLVVTVDEFEVEEALLTPRDKKRVDRLIEALTAYLAGEMNHPVAPLALFIATVGEREDHAVVRGMIERTRGADYRLKPWEVEAHFTLARKIHEIYLQAYHLTGSFVPDLAVDVLRELGGEGLGDSGLIRAFIKRYVGVLDSSYGPRAL